jgi:U-box domain/C2 domain
LFFSWATIMTESRYGGIAASLSTDEQDDCEDLDLTFDDIDEDGDVQNLSEPPYQQQHSHSTGAASASAAAASHQDDDDDYDDVCCQKNPCSVDDYGESEDYILGTLIVRVVAARELEPVNKHGIGNLIFGGGFHKKQPGTANPYASVRYGRTTQRTSQVFESTDPIWPRGEAMYMDVTHTAWETTTDQPEEGDGKENAAVPGNGDSRLADPGDPPKKVKSESTKALAFKSDHPQEKNKITVPICTYKPPPKPILTIAIFHSSEMGRLNKYPTNKGGGAGDSDDVFLGMTSIDVTSVITGKVRSFDEWLPLTGSHSERSTVRVVCEYESSDAVPHPGDRVTFNDYCHPVDLYPAVHSREYTVEEVDGDQVTVSWTSGEGWVSTFCVHRYMLIVVHRHITVVDICQDELASIRERIVFSPMVRTVQETVEQIPDEGLIAVGAGAIQNGWNLLNRWKEGGFETTVQDLTFATNWDGRHNPSTLDSLATDTDDVEEENDAEAVTVSPKSPVSDPGTSRLLLEPMLPNMPPCPITGEPMRDPVVAADGHTYERKAIARWFQESNKSPLTGSILPHKELVPNYMLLSSLREAAALKSEDSHDANACDHNEDLSMDGEVTAEVNIDD